MPGPARARFQDLLDDLEQHARFGSERRGPIGGAEEGLPQGVRAGLESWPDRFCAASPGDPSAILLARSRQAVPAAAASGMPAGLGHRNVTAASVAPPAISHPRNLSGAALTDAGMVTGSKKLISMPALAAAGAEPITAGTTVPARTPHRAATAGIPPDGHRNRRLPPDLPASC